MNTYDFDKTIFYPDSSFCFVRFCMRRYPLAVAKSLMGAIGAALSYATGSCGTKELKQRAFSFLPSIPDVDDAVREFWDENRGGIGEWYLRQKREDDVIISASPEFLLKPICDELGVTLIGTRMDKHSGRIDGENCHDVEKPKRFFAEFPNAHIHSFYSDSLSDSPMAELADEAFMVNKHSVSNWPK